MRLGSLFSGIGGFDVCFEQAGFSPIWQVEREPFCIAVLKTHWPNVERYYEIKDCGHGRKHKLKPVDCITAGVPCQDVSVAGKRAGLAGERTGLFYEFARILGELRPTWFVFENVPGLLSSNGGRDFAEIQRVLMVECGYGICWRVLDSQFFGVAQRRRRVFIVGYLGNPCPAEVLFDAPDEPGNFMPSREPGQEVAFALAASVRGSGDGHGNGWNSNYVVAATLQGSGHSEEPEPGPGIVPVMVADSITASYAKSCDSADSGRGPRNIVATLNSGGNSGGFRTEPGEHLVINSPDNANRSGDFTGLPKGMDSPRYRALGNAVTVSVAKWIGQRIINYEKRFA